MAIYTWVGPYGPGAASDPLNWWPVGVPQDGDAVIVNDGGIVDLTQLGNYNTVYVDNGALNFIGDNSISGSNPTVSQTSVITIADGPGVGNTGPNAGVVDTNGNFVNDGLIEANGGAVGSLLTLNIEAQSSGGTLSPGYFYNNDELLATAGDTLTINVLANSSLINNGQVYADGGTVKINVDPASIAGGVAPVEGFFLIGNGGTLETNVGYSASTVGVAPIYVFLDNAGNTLKIDNLATFGGRILGFGAGDTIDLGTNIAATQAVYDSSTGILNLENSSGTALASLRLVGEKYANASFTIGTGGDGNTILTDSAVVPQANSAGTWQTSSLWSTFAVPGANDAPIIGLGASSPYTMTTGSTPVSVNGFSVVNGATTLQVTSATTATEGVQAYGGTIEVTSGNTLTASNVEVSGTLSIDVSSTLSLTGHPLVKLANADDLLTVQTGTAPIGARIADGGVLNVYGAMNAGSSSIYVEDGGTLNFGAGGTLSLSSGNVYLRGGTISGTMTLSGSGDTIYVTSSPLDQDATAASQNAPWFADTIAGNLVATGNNDSLVFEIPATTGLANAQTFEYGGAYSLSGFKNLTVQNGDKLILDGAATNSANTTTVTAGSTLQIGNGGANGALQTSKIQLNGGAFVVDLSSTYGFGGSGGTIAGSGGVEQMGSGQLNLAGANSFTGGIKIDQGAVKLGVVGAEGSGAITFAGIGELKIAPTALTTNLIKGFVAGDQIDLLNIAYTGGAPTLSPADDTLSFTEGGTTYHLNFDASVAGQTFLATSDGSTGTLLTLQTAACYAAGTRIATRRGDVAIEDLSVGDLALTASGEARPIRWLGWRALKGSRHPHPELVRPCRVAAHAFGEGLPQRDLWLSPGHNIAVDGVLMPISALINGNSIAQVDADSVVYWHLELDSHDVVLAEGLAAESYLDCGNRSAFANCGDFVEAHPDFLPKEWRETCLPLVKEGPQVEAVKARLLASLAAQGHELTTEADAHILADGARVEPIRLSPTRLGFALPEGARELRLRSRAFTPSHTSAASRDPRTLGLEVARLEVDGADLRLGSEEFALSGWREAEFVEGRFNARWTDGAAELPAGARLVIVDLAGHGLYWRFPVAQAAANFSEAFDLSNAERVAESFLLEAKTEDGNWRVYEQGNAKEPIGLLCAQDSPATFLEKAYRCLLGREADESGLRTYEHALTVGELTRRAVIKELLLSEEGRRRGARLMVACAPERPLAA